MAVSAALVPHRCDHAARQSVIKTPRVDICIGGGEVLLCSPDLDCPVEHSARDRIDTYRQCRVNRIAIDGVTAAQRVEDLAIGEWRPGVAAAESKAGEEGRV